MSDELTLLDTPPVHLDFSDEELIAFIHPGADDIALPTEADRERVAPSGELQAVSRRIAGQFVDLIQAFSGTIFTRRPNPATTDQFKHALDALHRLAVATQDAPQIALLDEMRTALVELVDHHERGRVLDRFATWLRAWIPRFSATLDAADGERLVSLVSYRNQTIPLFAELGNIQGIGRRRLERLYCAGLYTVEAVCAADATELAQVTGLPQALAARVIEATRAYAVEQRRRCVFEMRDRARELARTMTSAQGADPELVRLAMSTMVELQSLLATLSHPEET